jgi:hypothetical protein
VVDGLAKMRRGFAGRLPENIATSSRCRSAKPDVHRAAAGFAAVAGTVVCTALAQFLCCSRRFLMWIVYGDHAPRSRTFVSDPLNDPERSGDHQQAAAPGLVLYRASCRRGPHRAQLQFLVDRVADNAGGGTAASPSQS